MHNLSCENEFDLKGNEGALKSHFNMKGCITRLASKQKFKQFGNGLLNVMVLRSASSQFNHTNSIMYFFMHFFFFYDVAYVFYTYLYLIS